MENPGSETWKFLIGEKDGNRKSEPKFRL
jgi:hypothetical protein